MNNLIKLLIILASFTTLPAMASYCWESRSIALDLIEKPANRLYDGSEKVIESLGEVVYWCDGVYVKREMEKISHFLRDRTSTGGVKPIDPKLIDVLYEIAQRLGYEGAVKIISGYRTHKSQARLVTGGNHTAARKSKHTQGTAVDFYIPGYVRLGKDKNCNKCRQHLYRTAFNVLEGLKLGGLGAYCGPSLHVDVRKGIPRDKGDKRSIVRRWGASMSLLDGTRNPTKKENRIGMPATCVG